MLELIGNLHGNIRQRDIYIVHVYRYVQYLANLFNSKKQPIKRDLVQRLLHKILYDQ